MNCLQLPRVQAPVAGNGVTSVSLAHLRNVLGHISNSYITGSRFVSDLSALGARARIAREHSADKSETNRGPVI